MTFESVVQPDGRKFLTIQAKFEEFDRLNPWVYAKLVAMARELRAKGIKQFGIKMLFEVLRWQYIKATTDPSSGYHLNNVYTSRYARKIMATEQDLKTAFETRILQTD